MKQFIENAMAFNVDSKKQCDAVIDLMNTGWLIIQTSQSRERATQRTITAVHTNNRDAVYADIRRRQIEFNYGVAA